MITTTTTTTTTNYYDYYCYFEFELYTIVQTHRKNSQEEAQARALACTHTKIT
jgi:hypothetical protein